MHLKPLSLIGSILLFFLVSCTSSKQESISDDSQYQMYHNGKILDKYKSERIDRECLVLKDGRSVFKGEIEYANEYYANAEAVDLKGRTLIYTENNGPTDFSQDIEAQVKEIPLHERANFALIYTDDQGTNIIEKIVRDGKLQYKKPGPTPEELAEQKAKEEEEARIAAVKKAEDDRIAAEAKIAAAAAAAAATAQLELDNKAAEEAKIAEEAKAAEEAKLAAEAKAAEEAKLAAEAKAAEDALNAANMRNVISIACQTSLAEEAKIEGKSLMLNSTLFVKKSKEDLAKVVSYRKVENFSSASDYTIEYHHKQANKKYLYHIEVELKKADKVIYSSTVPVTCTENGKLDQKEIKVILGAQIVEDVEVTEK